MELTDDSQLVELFGLAKRYGAVDCTNACRTAISKGEDTSLPIVLSLEDRAPPDQQETGLQPLIFFLYSISTLEGQKPRTPTAQRAAPRVVDQQDCKAIAGFAAGLTELQQIGHPLIGRTSPCENYIWDVLHTSALTERQRPNGPTGDQEATVRSATGPLRRDLCHTE